MSQHLVDVSRTAGEENVRVSNFAAYKLEREGKLVLERSEGFATYEFLPEGVYIEDIYVAKPFRRSNVAAGMADEICAEAKKRGITQLIGSVDTRAAGATTSVKVLLAYGMEIKTVSGPVIYFVKKI